jgi:hypothetical protein
MTNKSLYHVVRRVLTLEPEELKEFLSYTSRSRETTLMLIGYAVFGSAGRTVILVYYIIF